MIKKSLIALVILTIFGGTVHADEDWGVTTAMIWEWAKKDGPTVPILMKIVRWADLYLIEGQETLQLMQIGRHEFQACINLAVCNNFPRLQVDATLDPNELAVGPDAEWRILVDEGSGGTWSEWGELTDSTVVEDVHLTGNWGLLRLCVGVRNVDPQQHEFVPDQWVEAGLVYLTIYPADPPSAAEVAATYQSGNPDWNGAPGAFGPNDDINIPDVLHPIGPPTGTIPNPF